MKTLFLLRHAKSSHDLVGQRDHDRVLNARGIDDGPKVAAQLRKAGCPLGYVLCSTAVRAAQTWELVESELNFSGPVDFRSQLYLAPPSELLAQIASLPDDIECALLVAHNPGLEELVNILCDHRGGFPTAALARIELPVDRWSDLQPGKFRLAKLISVWKPKED